MAIKHALHFPIALGLTLFFCGQLFAAENSDEAFRQKNFDELEFETGGCKSFLKEQQTQIDKFKGTAAKAIQAIRDKNAKIQELEQQLAASSATAAPAPASCDSDTQMISRLTTEVATLGKENSDLVIQIAELKNNANQASSTSSAQTAQLNATIAALQAEIAKLKTENANLIATNASLVATAQAQPTPAPAPAPAVASSPAPTPTPAATPSAPVAVDTTRLSKIDVTKISATSQHHPAKNAIDGNKSTFWISANGSIQGQSLNLEWDEEKTISKINISVPQVHQNRRQPKQILLVFPDGSTQAFELTAKWGTHRIDIQPKTTQSMSIEIEALHPQEKKTPNQFISISEIEILGH
jgi:uncharacterized small protein (DUF1192 family)